MRKIGRQVLFLETGEDSARNGESTFIRLKDGRILFAYTQYYGGDYEDDGTARICGCCSCDEGETWSSPYVLLEKDPEAKNYMSPSLVRLPSGDLGMVLLRTEGFNCIPIFVRSSDEGKTWTPWRFCQIPMGHYCAVNDCAIVCKDGRILLPLSFHGTTGHPKAGSIVIACSTDEGSTWSLLPMELETAYADDTGFAEPGIFEHSDGTLWIYFRSAYGYQYHSVSADGGVTWTPAEPNFCFPSAESPMRVKRVGDYVISIFNPAAYSCVRPLLEKREGWGSPRRTPLVCTFDREDGKLFSRRGIAINGAYLKPLVDHTVYLEDDPEDSYCYPAIQEVPGGFLAAYYHSNGTDFCLNSTTIIKVSYEELTACD